MANWRVGVEYSPSKLEPVRPLAVSPDRALCLPTFIHFLIVNNTSLSLALSLSLSLLLLLLPPPPPPPSPSSSCFSCSSWTHRTLDNCSSADLVSNTVARSRAASFSFSVFSLNKPWSRAASRSFSAFGLNKPPRPPFLLLLPLSSSHFGQQLSRLLLGNAVGGKTGVHGEGLFESRSSFLLLPHSLIDLSELNRGGEIGFASVGLEQALYCLVV
jgi:hypothetical protein